MSRPDPFADLEPSTPLQRAALRLLCRAGCLPYRAVKGHVRRRWREQGIARVGRYEPGRGAFLVPTLLGLRVGDRLR